LKAKVHRQLPAERCAEIRTESLKYRPLSAEDFEETVALHTEWFPVTYDEVFYNKSVRGEIFTLAATHTEPSTGEESILGIVTMSTCQEHYKDDLPHVLGSNAKLHESGEHSDAANCSDNPDAPGVLAYILTLGVVDGFRRRGLASEMLKQSILHVEESKPHVQAVYLHVVTYNTAAIKLYESLKFARIAHFPNFYHLHGIPYDSYLYALYVHGSRPPWKWRLRHFLGLGMSSTWKDWAVAAWSSLWGSSCQTPGAATDVASPAESERGLP